MPFKRMCLAAAVSLLAVPAFAQDYGPYGMGGGLGFDWNGFYSGVYGGGSPMNDPMTWNGGIFTGVNVQIDSIILGAEAQVGTEFSDTFALDALLLAKGGLSLGSAAAYATAGGGLAGGDLSYAVGGGVEYGVTDYLSVRGDVLGLAEWGSGPDEVRLTAGFAFHL